jgi:predicted nucleic acid-binding protein
MLWLRSTATVRKRNDLPRYLGIAFEVEWVDKGLHDAGMRELTASPKRRLSLVDHISFLVMKRWNLTSAFAFDPDFKTAGFRLYEPS